MIGHAGGRREGDRCRISRALRITRREEKHTSLIARRARQVHTDVLRQSESNGTRVFRYIRHAVH